MYGCNECDHGLGFVAINPMTISIGMKVGGAIIGGVKSLFGGKSEEQKNQESLERLQPLVDRVRQGDVLAADRIRCGAGMQMRGAYCAGGVLEDAGERRTMWRDVADQVNAAGIPTLGKAEVMADVAGVKAVLLRQAQERAASAPAGIPMAATPAQEVVTAEAGKAVLPLALAAGAALFFIGS